MMEMDAPTPREFGQLEERVRSLDSKFNDMDVKIDRMAKQVDELTKLAERGRGAYWAALGIASGVGAIVAWVVKTFGSKAPL